MSYGNESKIGRVIGDAASLAPIAFQTPADKSFLRVLGPITVHRIGFLITTAVTVTAAVIDFDKRITPGSDTGRVDQGIGQITAPIGSAIGQIVYKNVRVDVNPGDEIVVQLVTASTAGAGVALFEYIPREETPLNYSEMIASV